VDGFPPKTRLDPFLEPVIDSNWCAGQDHVIVGIRVVAMFPKPRDSDAVGGDVVQDGKPCSTAAPSRHVVGLAGIERRIGEPLAWACKFYLEIIFPAKRRVPNYVIFGEGVGNTAVLIPANGGTHGFHES
jgi:hypothetical protein